MDSEAIRKAVFQVLGEIAPEVNPERIEPGVPFRDQFDFDSVNFMTFTEKLQALLKIQIPPTDCLRLASLEGCLNYLMNK
jgi:acyl carrier protein